MAAPPGEDGRDGHPTEQADGRLAVAGEDPVLPLEGVRGADLHRLVAPVDRVRADAALPVVDNRALVVRAEEDELPVELEEVGVSEAVDGAVLDGVAVADHAPETRLRRKHLGHRPATLADAAAQRSRKNDRHGEDRKHREDARDSESGLPMNGIRHDGSSTVPATADPRTTEPTTSTLSPVAARRMAPRHRARSPRRRARRRPRARPRRARGGIETLVDESRAVPHAEQRQADRHHRSSPQDKAAGEDCQPCKHADCGRPGVLARGQPNSDREEHRAQAGGDAGRYARIALA